MLSERVAFYFATRKGSFIEIGVFVNEIGFFVKQLGLFVLVVGFFHDAAFINIIKVQFERRR